MITTITVTGIIEAATAIHITMTFTGMKITIMIISRSPRKREEGAGSQHRYGIIQSNYYKLILYIHFLFFLILCGSLIVA